MGGRLVILALVSMFGVYYWITTPGQPLPDKQVRIAALQGREGRDWPASKPKFSLADIQNCEAAGGVLYDPQFVGNAAGAEDVCVGRLPDAGRICTDSQQCLGRCDPPFGLAQPQRFGLWGPQLGLCQANIDSGTHRDGCGYGVVNGDVKRLWCE